MKTLIDAQQEAIDAIVALRRYPNIGTRTGRLPRSIRPIRRRYFEISEALGCTAQQSSRAWTDIIDMVVLEDNAE